jgi:hypothetical protein
MVIYRANLGELDQDVRVVKVTRVADARRRHGGPRADLRGQWNCIAMTAVSS